MELLFIFLFGTLGTVVESSYFFVTAPNKIRFEHDEVVLVNVFEASNTAVTVWLEHKGKQFESKTVIVRDQQSPQELTIRVTEADIFDEDSDGVKPLFVKLFATGLGTTKETTLLINYNTGYLVVQTDKPIYSPGQTVNFRILPMTEHLRSASNVLVFADIIDAKNRTIRRKQLTEGTKIYSSSFVLPKKADLGVWTVRAFYGGQYNTESRACLQVDKYVLPRFEVSVSVERPYILPDSQTLRVYVDARYVYGKPVVGTAMLQVFLRNNNPMYREPVMNLLQSSLDWMQLQDGKAEYNIAVEDIMQSPKVQEDFGQMFPWGRGFFLELRCTVLESASGDEESGIHDKTLFVRNPYIFNFDKNLKTYRQGLSYNLQVYVKMADGSPLKDKNARIEVYEDGVLLPDKEVPRLNTGSNGHITASIATNFLSTNMEFKVVIEGHESDKFKIEANKGDNQVQVEMVEQEGVKKLFIFANQQGSRSYTGIMIMIIARGKVVYSKYEDAALQLKIPIDDNTLQKMSPSARAIVFYVDKSTGNIVSDSVKLDIEERRCEGKGLTLQSKAEYRPGQLGNLTISGSEGMVVGLNAIDKALLLLNSENILKQNKVFKMMEGHDVGCGQGGGRNSPEMFKTRFHLDAELASAMFQKFLDKRQEAAVYINAGAVLLTNADFVNEVLDSVSCEQKARKKRAAEGRRTNPNCYTQGERFAVVLLTENAAEEVKVDLKSKCYRKAISLINNKHLSAKCISAFFRACVDRLSEAFEEGKSDDAVIDYDTAIADHLFGINPKTRSNFKESWLFEQKVLDGDGKSTVQLMLPDTITTWSLQAVGISDTDGVCIADQLDVRTFQDFFIKVDLPYSAVRLENLNVPVTVFNYIPEEIEVLLWFQGDEGMCSPFSKEKEPSARGKVAANRARTFNFLMLPLEAKRYKITVSAIAITGSVNQGDEVQKELLVVHEGKEVTKTIIACLDPLNQMKDCQNSRNVYNISRIRGEETFNIQLPIAEEAIPDTASAVGYITSNLMADPINHMMSGVYELFKHPYGCGEQNIATTAPNVYALFYLKQTKQVTSDAETKSRKHIEYGVEEELKYRQPDNSYAALLRYTPSTWLSAFVVKVYCQAHKTLEDVVDMALHVTPTLNWLLTKHNNGHFFDSRMVSWRGMAGQMDEKGPELTAFVIISFQECDGRSQEMNRTISSAVSYLESLPNSTYTTDPYLLSLTTYALGISNSSQKWRFIDMLKATRIIDGDNVYWGNSANPSTAYNVETTAYGLLAFLTFQLYEDSAQVVRWLINQRDGKFRFTTTQDTVVALQALTEYSIHTAQNDVDLKVELRPDVGAKISTFNVTNYNKHVVHVADEIYHKKSLEGVIGVTVKGSGSAYLAIDLKYNQPQDVAETTCSFHVSDIAVRNLTNVAPLEPSVARERECDICNVCMKDPKEEDRDYDDDQFGVPAGDPDIGNGGGARQGGRRGGPVPRNQRPAQADAGPKPPMRYCIQMSITSDEVAGMSIVKFGLETGVTVEEEDLETMKTSGVIDDYETPATFKGYIIFYLQSLGSNIVELKFRVKDQFKGDVNSRQMANVIIYEYYRPEKTCTRFYSLAQQGDEPFKLDCSGKEKRQNCKCLRNICAKPKHKEFFKKIKRPAPWLEKRLCGDETAKQADYAVEVEIDNVGFNQYTHYMNATGTVIQVLKKGEEELRKHSEMFFLWKSVCPYPSLKQGKRYYIIARNGHKTMRNKQASYKYELMDGAIVFEKPVRPKKRTFNFYLKTMMENFRKTMKTKGCQS